MAGGTDTDFTVVSFGLLAPGGAGFRVHNPGDVFPVVKSDGQSHAGIFQLFAVILLCPCQVLFAGSVAGFAADVDIRPGGFKGICNGVVTLDQFGRMAVGAHVIPVLLQACPVQFITGIDGLVGIQMEPALPAITFRSSIPGDAQCLHTSVREFNQVLL